MHKKTIQAALLFLGMTAEFFRSYLKGLALGFFVQQTVNLIYAGSCIVINCVSYLIPEESGDLVQQGIAKIHTFRPQNAL